LNNSKTATLQNHHEDVRVLCINSATTEYVGILCFEGYYHLRFLW